MFIKNSKQPSVMCSSGQGFRHTSESWDKESVHTDGVVCLGGLIKQQDGTQQESEDQNSYSKPTWCYGHV